MIKKTIRMVVYLIVLLVVGIVVCNLWIKWTVENRVYTDINEIPANDVALVLGTSPQTVRGYDNPYFTTRMEAAVQLYQHQKVRHFILSGDNSTHQYNEPQAMKEALMERGIPESAITLDYAGFRTLDSVVRCKKIFQQDKATIVSQPFHNYRALFIARHRGVDAVAFNSEKVYRSRWNKTRFREYLARCKAVVDLFILRKDPKFLGEQEVIRID